MHVTQEGDTLKDAALSQQSVRVWPNAKSMMTYFFSRSLSTVALPPRATFTPVRFNRVYSKVSLGTLSVVYSAYFFFFFFFWFPECTNWNHKVNEADGPNRRDICILSLCCPSPLLGWCLRLRCQPVITSPVSSLFTSSSSMPPTRHTVVVFITSGAGGWEVVSRTCVTECRSLGWEERHEPVCVTEQEEGKMRMEERRQRPRRRDT